MNNFIPNSFQVPNALIDEVLDKMSGNACKIYLLIVRKTRGWHKEADRISYSQIQKYTGLNSRTTISKALDELIDLGLIIKEQGNQKSSNEYKLNDDFCTAKNEQPSPKNGLDKNCTSPKNGQASPKNGLQPSPKNGHTEIHSFKNTNIKDRREYDAHTHESQTVQDLQNPKNKATKPQITFAPPSDFKPTDNQITKCHENGLNPFDEFGNFINWAIANGKGYANWSMGFNTWINNSIRFAKSRTNPNRKDEFRDEKWQAVFGDNFYGDSSNQLTHIGE